jgi:microcystin-dependent protein
MVDSFIGEIRIFSGARAPAGWHLCDGTLLTVLDNEALYSLLGASYGGDGRTNFALPDLQGRLICSRGKRPDALLNYTLAQKIGVGAVTLTADQMPAHEHTMVASTQPATSIDPSGLFYATSSTAAHFYTNPSASGSLDRELDPAVLSKSGGDGAHSNVMPFLGINYIISLSGIYPTT